MARLKFYTDEHISRAVVKGLQARGIDAKSCVDLGMRTASDEKHLTFAKHEQRVIVTYDNDFLKLHEQGWPHAGIAFSTKPKSIGDMISILLLMYEVLTPEDMENSIEFI